MESFHPCSELTHTLLVVESVESLVSLRVWIAISPRFVLTEAESPIKSSIKRFPSCVSKKKFCAESFYVFIEIFSPYTNKSPAIKYLDSTVTSHYPEGHIITNLGK